MGAVARRWASQPQAHEVVCVCGVRGQGKSTWVRDFLSPVVRVFAWDPLDDYSETLGGPRITAPELAEMSLTHGVQRISIAPPDDFSQLDAHFSIFCDAVARTGNCCCVVEETSLVASPSSVPDGLKKLLAVGRHYGISMVLVAQRFAQMPRLATGMASRIVAFRQTEPSDVADLEKRLGAGAPDPRTLKKFSCIDWRPETGATVRGP